MCSLAGRAAVSKTEGRTFESYHARQKFERSNNMNKDNMLSSRNKVQYLIDSGWHRNLSGGLVHPHGTIIIPITQIKRMPWDKIKALQ